MVFFQNELIGVIKVSKLVKHLKNPWVLMTPVLKTIDLLTFSSCSFNFSCCY